MKTDLTRLRLSWLLPMAMLIIVALLPANARSVPSADRTQTFTRTVALQPPEPVPAPLPMEETIVIDQPIGECQVYEPPVRYRVRGHCPPCCAAKEPVEVTMFVKDPASCDCYAKIPICLPCCCVGEATICNRDGILGRRWVDYEWDCGFKVSVLFRTRGDVVVHYIF